MNVGTGLDFWNAPWVPKCVDFKPKPREPRAQVINWFLKLILENLRRWNLDKVAKYVRVMNNFLYIEVSNTI